MELLAVLAVLLLIITPILAIAAFVRVRRLEEQMRGGSLLTLGERLIALERRLLSIEKSLALKEPESPHEPKPAPAQFVAIPPPVTTSPSAPPPPVPASLKPRDVLPPQQFKVFAAPPLHSSKPKSSSGLDLETLIGGRWLNRIGIVAMIGAVTFFLKYAFDNNWIGPSGRIAIGVLLGAAMLPG